MTEQETFNSHVNRNDVEDERLLRALAAVHIQFGALGRANSILSLAATFSPRSIDVHVLRAIVDLRLGRIEAVEEHIERVFELGGMKTSTIARLQQQIDMRRTLNQRI